MCSNLHSSTWGGVDLYHFCSNFGLMWIYFLNWAPKPIHRVANDKTQIYSKPVTLIKPTAWDVLSVFEHILQFPAGLNKLTKNGIFYPYRRQVSL